VGVLALHPVGDEGKASFCDSAFANTAIKERECDPKILVDKTSDEAYVQKGNKGGLIKLVRKIACALFVCVGTAFGQIDPNILLQSKPVQIESSLDAQTKAQNLRNLQNQAEIQRRQIANQAELQAQQLQRQARQQHSDPVNEEPNHREQIAVRTDSSQVKSDSEIATWKTGGDWNGRFWKFLDHNDKGVFLIGYSSGQDALAIVMGQGDFERYKRASSVYWARTLTPAEISLALDQFYLQPENAPIEIKNAIHCISERAEGADEQVLQKEICDLRSQASK
jgi:hypothetical protein